MASIDLNTILKKRKDIRYTKVPEGGLVLKHDTAEIITLNPMAIEIYHKLDGKKSVRELINEILNEYDVEEERAKNDIIEFLNELVNKNLVEII